MHGEVHDPMLSFRSEIQPSHKFADCRFFEESKETKQKTKSSIMVKFSTAALGFSRTGPNREEVCQHWKGQL
jgi:hypothetical protein